MKLCLCSDPENCTQTVPGYVCRREAGVCGNRGSDTPRTDAETYCVPHEDALYKVEKLREVVAAEVCRRLERELAEARRYAERYRYWRDRHGWTGYFDDGLTNSEAPDDIDAAIDAAMKEVK